MRHRAIMLGIILSLAAPQIVHAGTAGYQTEVINSVTIGDISISLEEFEPGTGGSLVPYENGKIVLPGQKIDKIVRITNQANRAWVRARLEYTSDDGIKGMSDSAVSISGEKWVKANGYYYYTEPLGEKETVEFINAVRIPTEWDGSYAEKSFSVVVSADAVQESNFTPDFKSGDPWFGTVVEACTHTAYDPSYAGAGQFSVSFEGGAEGLVKVGDDFFSNFGELMPGDTVSDKVEIKNGYSRPVTVGFKTETVADDALLRALRLEIKKQDEMLYAGTMDGAVKDRVVIADLKSGESTELTYTLHVPAELDNSYAMSGTRTKWVFTAEVKGHGAGGGSGGGSGSPSRGPSARPGGGQVIMPIIKPFPEIVHQVREKTEEILQAIPKLGDGNGAVCLMAISIISGAGAVLLARSRTRRKKDGER